MEPDTEKKIKPEQLSDQFELESGQKHRIIVIKKKAVVLELEEVLFHLNSAVLLPTAPKPSQDINVNPPIRDQYLVTGLDVMVQIYIYVKENPQKRLVIAGHTDRSGGADYNFDLSRLRAESVLAVLVGDSEKWLDSVRDKNKVEDIQLILQYYHNKYGWPCDPGKVDNVKGPQTDAAIEEFQSSYNQEFHQSISVDGVVGEQTWGAIFDVYMRELQEIIDKKKVGDLDGLRANIKFIDDNKKVLACGESIPIDSSGIDGLKSQTNRRVELLFFDSDDLPEIDCPDQNNSPHPLETCPIYHQRWIDYEYIPCTIPDVPVDIDLVPAVILYPSLLTPLVLSGDHDSLFEILLLGKNGHEIKADNINLQLKISKGFDPEKGFKTSLLFPKNAKKYIKITPIDFTSQLLGTNTKFKGLVDKRFKNIFEKEGFTKLYSVEMPNEFCKSDGIYNLFWIYDEKEEEFKAELKEKYADSVQPFNIKESDKMLAREPQDVIMGKVLEEMNAKTSEGEAIKHCFRIKDNDVTPGDITYMNPIQSYHPVFYSQSLNYASIGHISDLHVCARQNLLQKSNARVIEYVENGKEADINQLSYIGSMVNVNSKNLKFLLTQMAQDKEVDIILITGDLIDYIKSLIPSRESMEHPTIKKIWDEVELDDNYTNHYKDFTDLISFYSLIVDFYSGSNPKPVFVTSGNHDCYYYPYGISPRVLDIKRANEGIPADHNLTIYEACLIFGETYGSIKQKGISNFDEDKFQWLYNVLTPFSDYSIQLPKQSIVGFAWGEDEDMFDFPFTNHGFGHLPRAETAVSNEQLPVLEHALQTGKEVIVMSHFTFISYTEKIPMNTKDEGDIEFDDYWDAGDHDMGTFEKNRKPIYEDYLYKNKIQCVLTGHSHRRGLYMINSVDYWGDNSVKSSFYDFDQWILIPGNVKRSAIIVSDSAGSVPRYNSSGEFQGWGSDTSSGSKVIMNQGNGDISRIEKIPAYHSTQNKNPKPRIIVTLDYMDILLSKFLGIVDYNIIETFETDTFSEEKEVEGTLDSYAFKIELNSDDIKPYVRIESVTIYSRWSEWIKIRLHYDHARDRWVISNTRDMHIFRFKIIKNKDRCHFLSIKFTSDHNLIKETYNLESPWNFECQAVKSRTPVPIIGPIIDSLSDSKQYCIKRKKKYAEIPDFKWRERLEKYK